MKMVVIFVMVNVKANSMYGDHSIYSAHVAKMLYSILPLRRKHELEKMTLSAAGAAN